jgi:hypothetical protein
MPNFRVRLHGTGIHLDGTGGGAPIVGFYATRVVRAESRDDAAKVATRSVSEQWRNDPAYAKNNRGAPPTLCVEWVRDETLLGGLFLRSVGHTFYPAEPSA